MIRSFRCRDTEKVFNYQLSLRWSAPVRKAALRRLYAVHAAASLLDLRSPPSNHLEKLRGNRTGQYSIRINEQWRICFEWHDNGAWKVEIVDYH